MKAPRYVVIEVEMDKLFKVAFAWPYENKGQPIYRMLSMEFATETGAADHCRRMNKHFEECEAEVETS